MCRSTKTFLIKIGVCLHIFILATLAISSDDAYLWKEYKTNYSKTYNSVEEETQRFLIFKDNLKEIEEHNARYTAGLESYTLGINKFSDMTYQEYVDETSELELPVLGENDTFFRLSHDTLIPAELDWRDYHVVTPVKEQGKCGCCYAFVGLGALESLILQKLNFTHDFSEQQIVDCTKSYGNKGCRGGYMNYVYEYTTAIGTIEEYDYPYLAKQGTCKSDPARISFRTTGYKFVEPNSEEALKAAVATIGPIGVGVDSKELKGYKDGIFEPKRPLRSINHALLIVGYGEQGGVAYWVAKNSFGTTWGENGYLRIKRNSPVNMGITSAPVYPLID